ncbi:helix-turn-helix transcriptional regulator [Streptosporangiaceae bacterium NEAU-GS5]|nr:helix-turn-helix transcriptional regulator [Streptosporangiaceae bacterium NEAU-GS5]
MRRTSFADYRCSLSRSLELMGDWWTMLILRDLYLGINRFDDLVEDIGISRNLLTTRLGDLVAHGLAERRAYQEHPPRFEYVLTEPGAELVPIVLALTAWGDKWAPPPEGQPLVFRHDRCGQIFTPRVSCDACGEPIVADEVTTLPGPGGGPGPGAYVLARRLAEKVASGELSRPG